MAKRRAAKDKSPIDYKAQLNDPHYRRMRGLYAEIALLEEIDEIGWRPKRSELAEFIVEYTALYEQDDVPPLPVSILRQVADRLAKGGVRGSAKEISLADYQRRFLATSDHERIPHMKPKAGKKLNRADAIAGILTEHKISSAKTLERWRTRKWKKRKAANEKLRRRAQS